MTADPAFRFIPLAHTDNPWLHPDYIPNLKKAWKHRPDILAAYVDGIWDAVGDFDTFIAYKDVVNCTLRDPSLMINNPTWRCVSADCARMGDDETVFYAWEGRRQLAVHIIGKCDHRICAQELIKFAELHLAKTYYIEDDTYGNPVIVEIKATKPEITVWGIQPGSTDVKDPHRFVNVRAEMWYTSGRLFSEARVSVLDDEKQRSQLSSVRFKHGSRERLLAELKEDYKAREGGVEGGSPDRGDACVIGLYGMEIHPPTERHVGGKPWTSTPAGQPAYIDFSRR